MLHRRCSSTGLRMSWMFGFICMAELNSKVLFSTQNYNCFPLLMVACVHLGEGSMAIWPARPSAGGPQLNIVQRHTACSGSLRDDSLTPPDWKPTDEIRNPCSWHTGAQCVQDRAHHSCLLGNLSHHERVQALLQWMKPSPTVTLHPHFVRQRTWSS
jgi:hypothetical protein